MKIQVTIKNVYGNDLIYPVCETSKNLADLADKRTLTHREIKIIKRLGYSIEVVAAVGTIESDVRRTLVTL